MRGAGCTYNDIVDRDIDKLVERTRSRPLPSGGVSVQGALAFLALQAAVGLAVLLSFNSVTVATGLASLAIVAAYPFMKRITWWPQLTLGLAFSWGALIGWAAVFGRLDAPALLLYAGCIAWVVGYDTIYAHQDRDDDALVGVRSTALLFGTRTKPWLAGFYGLAVLLIGAGFVMAGARGPALIGLGAFALHLGWQVYRLDVADARNCLTVFRSNRDAGLILFAGLVLDALWRSHA
jgi:4-hydroxybenzoate polyprenyltransferase